MNSKVAIVALVVLCGTLHCADAHFTIEGPAPSREKQFEPGYCYWPIAGAGAFETRPKTDCLNYKRGQVANLNPGQTVDVKYDIADTANHPGPCNAQLIDLSSGQVTDLGREENCISRRAAMTVKLPSKTCTNCVIKIKVTATHLAPQVTEYYDSCMDVAIGSDAGTPAPGPAPAPEPVPSPSPKPTSTPSEPREPKPTDVPDNGDNAGNGDNGNDDNNGSNGNNGNNGNRGSDDGNNGGDDRGSRRQGRRQLALHSGRKQRSPAREQIMRRYGNPAQ